MKTPKTLQQATSTSPMLITASELHGETAMARWNRDLPHLWCKDVSFLANQKKWQCKSAHVKRQFSAKVGTIFEDSPLGLEKWLPCVWLITNSKNGVSSCEIARSLGVTQKTAWFMLHRIRFAMKENPFNIYMGKLGGSDGERSKWMSRLSAANWRTCTRAVRRRCKRLAQRLTPMNTFSGTRTRLQ